MGMPGGHERREERQGLGLHAHAEVPGAMSQPETTHLRATLTAAKQPQLWPLPLGPAIVPGPLSPPRHASRVFTGASWLCPPVSPPAGLSCPAFPFAFSLPASHGSSQPGKLSRPTFADPRGPLLWPSARLSRSQASQQGHQVDKTHALADDSWRPLDLTASSHP